jgi:glycosyltransferase involved in cell wall biosynthesis
MDEDTPPQPSLLYVSTLDHIVRVMLPHLDEARARGWRVEVACQVTRFRDDVAPHADAIHDLPIQRFPLHPANGVALARLTRIIRKGRYTVVHCHNPTGGVVGRLAATLAGTGALRVYTAHGFHFHRHGGRVSNALYRGIETVAGRMLSDAVFVINREDYDAARDRVVPSDRLFLTGGVGVSAREQFDPARVTKDVRAAIRREVGAEDPSVPVLTVVGEMIPRKRHADALLAFSRLLRTHPGAVLLLVGEGVLMERLRARAVELGVADNVRFLGFRQDIADILGATDVFVFPSGQEGLPCSVQESLAMGVPVVATDVRGCADLVDDSCGRLAPLGDTDALAARLSELIDIGTEGRARLGAAGRARMLERYERSACVAQWLALYDDLLAGRGGARRGVGSSVRGGGGGGVGVAR